jgi:hypothetical protein
MLHRTSPLDLIKWLQSPFKSKTVLLMPLVVLLSITWCRNAEKLALESAENNSKPSSDRKFIAEIVKVVVKFEIMEAE